MSFRGFFSTKTKKEKKQKSKPLPSAQDIYDVATRYLEKFSKLSSLTDGEHKNKHAIDFLKELHHDAIAVNCRIALHEKFEKAHCAENIDFLFNYFDMKSPILKEQWQAFYHQYVEEDKHNQSIRFTEINIDNIDRALFLQLNGKILMGESDIEKIALRFTGKVNKSYTGKTFMEHISVELAGAILGRSELIESALSELQQKTLAAGAQARDSPRRTNY